MRSTRTIFPKIFPVVALTWVLASGALASSGHPEGGDGRGLSIKLEVPWTTLNVGEKLVFRYTLQNASDRPVPVAIPVEKYGLGAITGGQAFFEAFRTGGRKLDDQEYDVRTAPWPPRTAPEDEEPQAWTWLPPGHQLTWNQNQLWAGHYGVGCYQSFEGFRGHWLSGPSQWVSSNQIKVEIVSVPQSEWTELFKVQWISNGYRGGPRERIFYRIPISGRMYLFSGAGTRITEVDPADQFEYSVDQDGTNLEITIKGATGSRKVYFHLAQGYTRDTPWPVGPSSIFAPKPEPIPPAELKALRQKLLQGGDSDDKAFHPPAPREPGRIDDPEVPRHEDAHVPVWPWIGGVLALLSILTITVWKLRSQKIFSS